MKYLAPFMAKKFQAFRSFLAIVLLATAAIGCGKTQPACIDDATIALVKQGVEESLQENMAGANDTALLDRLKKRIQIAVTTIRTANKDEKVGKVTCDASLEITLAKVSDIVTDPVFKSLQESKRFTQDVETNGLAWKSGIQYTAQRTEDTNNLVVSLSGHTSMVQLLSTLAQAGVMDPKLPPAAFPTTLLASGNAHEAAARLMNHIYGKQEPKNGC